MAIVPPVLLLVNQVILCGIGLEDREDNYWQGGFRKSFAAVVYIAS